MRKCSWLEILVQIEYNRNKRRFYLSCDKFSSSSSLLFVTHMSILFVYSCFAVIISHVAYAYFSCNTYERSGEAIKMQNLHRLRCGTIAYCISENNVWRLSTSRPRQFAKISDVPTWQTIPKRLCKFIFCSLLPPLSFSLSHTSLHGISVLNFQIAASHEDKNNYQM